MQQSYIIPEPFIFESGESINHLNIAYHTFGSRNKDDSNIIWVFHALTANSDVSDWWPTLFGKGQILDPEHYFIICANTIGSPYGSSCPTDLNFPMFTVQDISRANIHLANYLNIEHIHLAIGGSFGGNQALEFSIQFRGKIKHLVLIASCAKESAWAIAVHETQRLAMKSDPTFGEPDGGREGIKAARAIGMLTYRTSQQFIDKQTDKEEKLDDYMASSYINYHGEKFADRFTALSYFYLTKCLDSHDVGRNRGGLKAALNKMHIPTLVIGIDSDLLIPTPLQKQMIEHLPNANYLEIHSQSGHDGFLLEGKQLNDAILPFLKASPRNYHVHKFGGKSLDNGKSIQEVLDIIEEESKDNNIIVIVSARGNTTDELIEIYHKAVQQEAYEDQLQALLFHQQDKQVIDLDELQLALSKLLQAVTVLGIDNNDIKDKIVAFGELFSAKAITHWLNDRGIKCLNIDAREIIKTKQDEEYHVIDQKISRTLTREYLLQLPEDTIPIITGFISSDINNKTTNLGRNGSNYSASLIASFMHADAVYNWTDVDGIFSANPKYVSSARQIAHLNFREANELANLGAHILHSKTILPLIENDIPLFIKNSHKRHLPGTRIDKAGSKSGIKAVTTIEDISLIAIEGGGLLGQVGIDSRIFTALGNNRISVRLISQASTERGIGFVVDAAKSTLALNVLQNEFAKELANQTISSLTANNQICIISITGRHNYALEKAIHGLRTNKIWVHLFSNSINGENISLVINKSKMIEALNIVHEYVV